MRNMKQFLITAALLFALIAPASAQVLFGPGGIGPPVCVTTKGDQPEQDCDQYPSQDVFLESAWGCDLKVTKHGKLYCANYQSPKETNDPPSKNDTRDRHCVCDDQSCDGIY